MKVAVGPGKYDDACGAAREATGGETVILIVVNGTKGSGFAVQSVKAASVVALPRLLRDTAHLIETSQGG